jgi:hypothetical protein
MTNRVEPDYVNPDVVDTQSNPFQYGWPQLPRSSALGERVEDKHTEGHHRGPVLSKDIGRASRQMVRRLNLPSGRLQDESSPKADFPAGYSNFNYHPSEDLREQEPEVVEASILNSNN